MNESIIDFKEQHYEKEIAKVEKKRLSEMNLKDSHENFNIAKTNIQNADSAIFALLGAKQHKIQELTADQSTSKSLNLTFKN